MLNLSAMRRIFFYLKNRSDTFRQYENPIALDALQSPKFANKYCFETLT